MNPKKILIVKHGSLGDIISATTAFKSLRDKYSSSTIHLLTTDYKYNYPLGADYLVYVQEQTR